MDLFKRGSGHFFSEKLFSRFLEFWKSAIDQVLVSLFVFFPPEFVLLNSVIGHTVVNKLRSVSESIDISDNSLLHSWFYCKLEQKKITFVKFVVFEFALYMNPCRHII